MTHTTPLQARRSAVRQLAAAAAATALLAAAGSAQAVVSAPGTTDFAGSMVDIAYGNGGNILQLDPALFVLGLSDSDNPQTVVNRNAALRYSFAVAGAGTGLMTIDYRVRNVSAVESFSQLRFMVFANPDSNPIDYLDTIGETWGARVAGDAALREGRGFIDPITGIKPGFGVNNNLTEGARAIDLGCSAAPGCDATVGMQWNAALLQPGETFHVRLGLSDDGQTISSRFMTIADTGGSGNVLTFSGQGNVVPVPEPGTLAMLCAGLLGLGFLARRRGAAAAG